MFTFVLVGLQNHMKQKIFVVQLEYFLLKRSGCEMRMGHELFIKPFAGFVLPHGIRNGSFCPYI